MTKKHFIALADAIREHNRLTVVKPFDKDQLDTLCDFMRQQNCNFKSDRWREYVAGHCGPNGGTIKREKVAA